LLVIQSVLDMDNRNLNNENIEDLNIEEKSSGNKNSKKYKKIHRQRQREQKKEKRQVNIFENKQIVLPGHHFCDCQGTEHQVLNNCLNCGRIACIQEGSGPCSFCGHLVLSKAEMLNEADDPKELLIPSQCNEPFTLAKLSEDLQKALECKDKLLEYQKDSVRRTTIYDDQSDYFMMSGGKSWLSDKEKAEKEGKYNELLAKKYAPRSERKIIIGFGPDEIVEQSTSYNLCSDEFAKSTTESETTVLPKSLVANQKIAAEYIPRVENLNFNNAEHVGRSVEQIPRLQDDYLTEIHDAGICLSVHQPFASLLICGIKRFEGRSWYSTHRGILWIASTAKPLNHTEKEEIENFYLRLYNDQLPKPFPEKFTTGCLLGCVNMVDCLPQEQFFEQYPNGEVESPYVFIFENPIELRIKIPISGKRRLFIICERLQVKVLHFVEKFHIYLL
ncbi:Activating signal cointegrator 1, partial [Trichinella pseudospiralis]